MKLLMKFKRSALFLLCLLLLLTALPAAAAEDSRWVAATSNDKKGNTVVDFPEVQFTLPADWIGKVQLEISPDANRANVYHTASREKWTEELGTETGGFLFGIVFTEEAAEEGDDVVLIGQTADGYYYAYFPTDVQAYTKDAETADDYDALWSEIDWVKKHCKLTADPVEEASEEESDYIIPNSSTAYLTESDLAGMSADDVQMAINEIYARHHRKFKMESVQSYFDKQPWYKGSIDPDDFDENYKKDVMNDYENANIDLMSKYMEKIS